MFLHIFITFNGMKTDFLLCLRSLDLFAILIKLRDLIILCRLLIAGTVTAFVTGFMEGVVIFDAES